MRPLDARGAANLFCSVEGAVRPAGVDTVCSGPGSGTVASPSAAAIVMRNGGARSAPGSTFREQHDVALTPAATAFSSDGISSGHLMRRRRGARIAPASPPCGVAPDSVFAAGHRPGRSDRM